METDYSAGGAEMNKEPWTCTFGLDKSKIKKTQKKSMTTEPINDGGPAYPSGKSEKAGFENSHPLHEGMSLRDYFAGQWLAGLGSSSESSNYLDEIAKGCYRIADAMLEARTKQD